jgi:uncharacterized membrane protein YhaH (DUF805 family)
MFCPNCGEKLLQDDYNSCPYCGKDLRMVNNDNQQRAAMVYGASYEQTNHDYYRGVIEAYKSSFLLKTKGGINIKEYWLAFLLHYAVVLITSFFLGFFLGYLTEITGDPFYLNFVFDVLVPFEQIAYLLIGIPTLTLGIRRMHDVGKSGWFILVPVYNLVLTLSPSKLADNSYR